MDNEELRGIIDKLTIRLVTSAKIVNHYGRPDVMDLERNLVYFGLVSSDKDALAYCGCEVRVLSYEDAEGFMHVSKVMVDGKDTKFRQWRSRRPRSSANTDRPA